MCDLQLDLISAVSSPPPPPPPETKYLKTVQDAYRAFILMQYDIRMYSCTECTVYDMAGC